MIDLIIDLPEECKTADEILITLYEKRKDLIEADVFEPNRFTVCLSHQQMDALKDCKMNLFHAKSTPCDANPTIAGFIVEVRN